jgi:hypothetical protein
MELFGNSELSVTARAADTTSELTKACSDLFLARQPAGRNAASAYCSLLDFRTNTVHLIARHHSDLLIGRMWRDKIT